MADAAKHERRGKKKQRSSQHQATRGMNETLSADGSGESIDAEPNTSAIRQSNREPTSSGDGGDNEKGISSILARKEAILKKAELRRTSLKITEEFAQKTSQVLTELNKLTDVKGRSESFFEQHARYLKVGLPFSIAVNQLTELKTFYSGRRSENPKIIQDKIELLIAEALSAIEHSSDEAQQQEERTNQEREKKQKEMLEERQKEDENRRLKEAENRRRQEEQRQKKEADLLRREATLRQDDNFWQQKLGDNAKAFESYRSSLGVDQLEVLAKVGEKVDRDLFANVLRDGEDMVRDVADALLMKTSRSPSDLNTVVDSLNVDLEKWYSEENQKKQVSPNQYTKFTGFNEFLEHGNLSVALKKRYQDTISKTCQEVAGRLQGDAVGVFGNDTPAVAAALPWSMETNYLINYKNVDPPYNWVRMQENQLFNYVNGKHINGLHPLLREKVLAQIRTVLDLGEEEKKINGLPGLHAEVFAVNNALWDRYRGEAPQEPEPVRFIVLRGRSALGADEGKKLLNEQDRGRDMPPCPNCQAILKGQVLIKKGTFTEETV